MEVNICNKFYLHILKWKTIMHELIKTFGPDLYIYTKSFIKLLLKGYGTCSNT